MTQTLISAAQLAAFAPKCPNVAVAAAALDAAARKYGIDTPREIRHWMATLHHESQGFTRLEENLNYSAKRLCEVWPGRFPTLAKAQPYANNPEKLANFVYGGRLGNTRPDSGWRYRGSAWGQITGYDNFVAASRATGINFAATPDLLRQPAGAAAASAAFWGLNGFNNIVAEDPGEVIVSRLEEHLLRNEEDDLLQARSRYNGGRIGIDDVRAQLGRAAKIWGK